MIQKLFDSEFKVMELIWAKEPVSAKDVALMAEGAYGWNKNTTYTVIKKLEAKGHLRREDPGFICTARLTREQVCREETRGLIDRLFGGSKKALFAALIEEEPLSAEELEALRRMIDKE